MCRGFHGNSFAAKVLRRSWTLAGSIRSHQLQLRDIAGPTSKFARRRQTPWVSRRTSVLLGLFANGMHRSDTDELIDPRCRRLVSQDRP
jgi:hypothetical protein